MHTVPAMHSVFFTKQGQKCHFMHGQISWCLEITAFQLEQPVKKIFLKTTPFFPIVKSIMATYKLHRHQKLFVVKIFLWKEF